MTTPYISPDVQTVERWINEPDILPANVTVEALLVSLYDALKRAEELNKTMEENTALLEKSNAEIIRLSNEMSKRSEDGTSDKYALFAQYMSLPGKDRKEFFTAAVNAMREEVGAI